MASVKITGVNEVLSNLNKINDLVLKDIKLSLNDSLVDLKAKTYPLVPIDTTDLRESGRIVTQNTFDTFVSELFYSATNKGYNYSVIQHETLWFNHPRGGQAKYLEQPFKENEKTYMGNIEKAVRNAVK
jgi:hypothetical protein